MGDKSIQQFLDITIHQLPVAYTTLDSIEYDHYTRYLIRYQGSEGVPIPAFLFLPVNQAIKGAILVHHQHNAERHLGKSEVAGILGDPYQYFCPALAERGFICLAPDSICFEDRRNNMQGTDPAEDPDDDVLQHYNAMSYRVLRGSSLMKTVIEDSSIAISLLSHLPQRANLPIGILGHSYGGNTVIFHAPLDPRIQYACTSGAVCSYQYRMQAGTGIELAQVIPGFIANYDIPDLLTLFCPRKLLILSASNDPFSADAPRIYEQLLKAYQSVDQAKQVQHLHYQGEHALDSKRFQAILDWFQMEYS